MFKSELIKYMPIVVWKPIIYFKTENGDKGYINVTKDDYESTVGEFYIEEERLVDYFDGGEISWAG